MMVIGLTGGVGTGKSTVATIFRALGARVIDADRLAHEVTAPRRAAWRGIVQAFGREVLNTDHTVNRARLAARVFRDPRARRRLERMVHPPVWRLIRQQLARLRRGGRVRTVVLDVPLLIEAGGVRVADVLVVVTASRAVQERRLRARWGWSRQEIRDRIAAQWDVSAKAALADYVVENSGSVQATRRQVKRLWKQVGRLNG